MTGSNIVLPYYHETVPLKYAIHTICTEEPWAENLPHQIFESFFICIQIEISSKIGMKSQVKTLMRKLMSGAAHSSDYSLLYKRESCYKLL